MDKPIGFQLGTNQLSPVFKQKLTEFTKSSQGKGLGVEIRNQGGNTVIHVNDSNQKNYNSTQIQNFEKWLGNMANTSVGAGGAFNAPVKMVKTKFYQPSNTQPVASFGAKMNPYGSPLPGMSSRPQPGGQPIGQPQVGSFAPRPQVPSISQPPAVQNLGYKPLSSMINKVAEAKPAAISEATNINQMSARSQEFHNQNAAEFVRPPTEVELQQSQLQQQPGPVTPDTIMPGETINNGNNQVDSSV